MPAAVIGLEIPGGHSIVNQLDSGLKPITPEFFAAARGNSMCTILKYLEDTAGDVIPGLVFPRGYRVYELDADLMPRPKDFSTRLMAIPFVPS